MTNILFCGREDTRIPKMQDSLTLVENLKKMDPTLLPYDKLKG
jgi:hypothetical protein